MTIPMEECPDVRWLGPRRFIFALPFTWKLPPADRTSPAIAGHLITIPQYFTCDGASIPRIVFGAIAPSDLSEAAWGLHDFLYRNGGVFDCECGERVRLTRKEVDSLFNEINVRHGVTPWKRRAAYLGVRLGGRFGFAKPKEQQ